MKVGLSAEATREKVPTESLKVVNKSICRSITFRVPLICQLAGTNSIGHQVLPGAVLVSQATSDYIPGNGTKCSAHGAFAITERGRGVVPS